MALLKLYDTVLDRAIDDWHRGGADLNGGLFLRS